MVLWGLSFTECTCYLINDANNIDMAEMSKKTHLHEGFFLISHFSSHYGKLYSHFPFQIRKLPGLLPSLKMGQVDCSLLKKLCDDLYIAKTPTFMIFKPGGGYELHHVSFGFLTTSFFFCFVVLLRRGTLCLWNLI